MFDFFKSRREEPPAQREPSVQEARAARRESLLDRLHWLDARMGVLADQAAQFRARHMATTADGRVLLMADDPFVRERLDAEWHGILVSVDVITAERNRILAEWVRLGEQEEYEKSHAQ